MTTLRLPRINILPFTIEDGCIIIDSDDLCEVAFKLFNYDLGYFFPTTGYYGCGFVFKEQNVLGVGSISEILCFLVDRGLMPEGKYSIHKKSYYESNT